MIDIEHIEGGIAGFFIFAIGLYLNYLKDKAKIDVESIKAESDLDEKERELQEFLLDSARDWLDEYKSEINKLKIEYRDDIRSLKSEVNHLSRVASSAETRIEELIVLCTKKLKEAGLKTEEIDVLQMREKFNTEKDK